MSIRVPHQVTVVSGATGCGKTTQIPQLLLDDAIERGAGGPTHIICTQVTSPLHSQPCRLFRVPLVVVVPQQHHPSPF
jgi:ABC-type lipoprotein export system ATPase subunit